ncbi:MAG TPA: TonB-dependent receptor [Allosphingosinicella sp.]|jgi:outer membrane receptor protein involved in Fe transport
MRKFGLLGTSALGSFTFVGLSLALASPASAQAQAEEDPEAQVGQSEAEIESGTQADVGAQGEGAAPTAAQDSGTITVTGSRIRRPNLESTVPITSIGGEQFFQQGQTNIGDTLNDLPQLRSTFAQQNPGLGIGIAGLNLLDLRGLGTQRTLVLVNGRRHVPADILNNAVSPDINTIPNDLIERVDIVTGGNSAIYGSDAIAGVVNFVLRRNFDGYQVRGQAGVTGEGFSGNQYVSAMAGRNFGGGRGNVTLHGEYARTDRVFASDVDAFRRQDNFIGIDLDGGAGLVNGGDQFPDTAFFTDIRSSTIHFNGIVPISFRPDNPNTPVFEGGPCGNATAANNGPTNANGTPFNCTYIFAQDGTLVPQTGTRIGTSQNPVFLGGNGQTGREGRNVSILPFTERFNVNMLAHYEFSDAAEVFVEAKWNRVNALGNNAGPSFIQSGNAVNGSIGDFRERIRLDNPFLRPQDSAFLAAQILASNCNPQITTACPLFTDIDPGPAVNNIPGDLTAAQRAAIAAGTYRVLVARNLLDVGLRDEDFKRDTYRVVAGLRGTFNDDWSYEVSANYGKFREDITTGGFIDRQRFSLAMDAGRNPVTGQIQCRSQFDPAAAVPIARTPAILVAENAARLAADIAACVPYNPLGGADNSAAIAYFARTFTASSGLSQLVLSGFVSGDSSQVFELPGGPIRFAVGAEYRREKAFYEQDPFVTQGYTNGVSIPSFQPDPFTVKEAFAEIQIPVLKDVPFFEELTLSGAARVAKYQGGTGTVWSYNAGVDWSPVRDIRFRGNYSRAVRAPNVSETAFPQVPNFAPGFQDPCQPNQINAGTSSRPGNCAAALGPLLPLLSSVAPSLGIISGSNVDLVAETSNSWTLGAVFQPRWVRGLSLSVDYFDIEVKDVIVSLSAQAIVNACYDQAQFPDNPFCPQFTRNLTSGPGPNGEGAGRVIENSLIVEPLNFASRRRRGVDVNFAYRHDFGPVDFNTSLIYTHQFENANFQNPSDPTFETRVLNQLGDPTDEFRWDFDFGLGDVTLGYRMRYIGPQLITTYASLFPINGLPPGNVDAFPVERFDDVMYHDLRVDFDLAKDQNGNTLKFYFGVDNVLDRGVPRGATTATGAGSAIFSFRGRTFYGGFRARF